MSQKSKPDKLNKSYYYKMYFNMSFELPAHQIKHFSDVFSKLLIGMLLHTGLSISRICITNWCQCFLNQLCVKGFWLNKKNKRFFQLYHIFCLIRNSNKCQCYGNNVNRTQINEIYFNSLLYVISRHALAIRITL